MTQPVFTDARAAAAGTFAYRIAVQLDFGSGSDLALLVQAFVGGGGSAVNITSCTVGGTISGGTTTGTVGVAGTKNVDGTISGGTSLTMETQIAGASFVGTVGTARAARLSSGVPTGVQWVQIVCDTNNGKPAIIASAASGVSGVNAGSSFTGSSTAVSISVSSTADDLPTALFFASIDDSYTASATSPTVQRRRGLVADADSGYNSFAWEETGASGTVALAGSITGTFTPAWAGTAWNLAGVASAGPTITGPSGAAGAGSSTANIAENASTGPTFTTDIALGGGYPTLTGAQAANWAITALSSTSWRIDPVTPFNFEAGGLVNPQAIVFNASASVSQSCSVTVTNANEAPTFSGTVSVPTLTQGSAMTPVNAGALFSDPDSGDTAAYSAVGVWPAGVTVDGSTGIISGTPSAAATYANLRVRRTDAGTLTADSNLFTITVAASGGVTFTGTVPAQSGTVGTAFSLALASYFSGTGTYEVQAGTLPPGLARDINTGAITGTPTTAGTYSGVVIRKTAASGSPATADTNAFAFTIAAAPAVAGFDLDTAAGCVFGAIAGSLTSISREVGVAYKVAVYNTSTRALIFESASLTTNSAGRLSRFTTGLCTIGVTYDLVAKRVSDGAIACFRLAAT